MCVENYRYFFSFSIQESNQPSYSTSFYNYRLLSSFSMVWFQATWLYILLIVMVFLVLGLIVYYAFSSLNSTLNQPQALPEVAFQTIILDKSAPGDVKTINVDTNIGSDTSLNVDPNLVIPPTTNVNVQTTNLSQNPIDTSTVVGPNLVIPPTTNTNVNSNVNATQFDATTNISQNFPSQNLQQTSTDFSSPQAPEAPPL